MKLPASRRQFLKTSAVLSASALATGAWGNSFLESKLKAGVAKRRVTPPLAIPYLTSSGNGANAPFQSVHCDLFARALVLDDGQKQMALLAVDSIGYDNTILGKGRHFTRELRQKISVKTKLRPEAIMLTATHAHSTPETIGLSPFAETAGAKEWLENHLNELADTVIEACKKREQVFTFHGSDKVEGIARHRRIILKNGRQNRQGPLPKAEEVARPWALDEELSIVYLRRMDGSPHSALLNFTAHPVVAMVLPQVCADYPGVAAEFVETQLPGAICLFTQGAAGNINSVHVSTGYADVEKLGTKLGEAAVTKIKRFEVNELLRNTTLHFHQVEIPLAARPCPSLPDAEQTMWAQPTSAHQKIFRLAKKLRDDDLRAELQAMALGPVKWISLPGEPFVETGFALKDAGASYVVGYANGWHGYFPIRRAYDEGGYETEIGAWSRVAPGSAEQLESSGKILLKKLGG